MKSPRTHAVRGLHPPSGEVDAKLGVHRLPYNLWFASATLLLLADVFHQSFRVALGEAGALAHPKLSLGIYIGFAVVWGIGLFATFGKKKR